MRWNFNDYTLDTKIWELRYRGSKIPLALKPFTLLVYLITYRPDLVTRDKLIKHLYPEQPYVNDEALNTCVRDARRAIGDIAQTEPFIQVVHGRGYRFTATVEEDSSSDKSEEPYKESLVKWSEAELQRIELILEEAKKMLPAQPVKLQLLARTIATPQELLHAVCELWCKMGKMIQEEQDTYIFCATG